MYNKIKKRLYVKKYLIYKITSPSGKSYIGQTSNYPKRMKEHNTASNKCRLLCNAIRKYNWDNFIKQILIENITIEEANQLEEQYIKEHNTLTPNGYNLVPGGLNHTHSLESILKISLTKKGQPSNRKGIKQSLEHIEKRATANRGLKRSQESKLLTSRTNARTGKPAWNRGIPSSKQAKEKRSKYSPSKETTQKMSNTLKSKPPVTYPFCGKIGKMPAMDRWHFNNCKYKKQ